MNVEKIYRTSLFFIFVLVILMFVCIGKILDNHMVVAPKIALCLSLCSCGIGLFSFVAMACLDPYTK